MQLQIITLAQDEGRQVRLKAIKTKLRHCDAVGDFSQHSQKRGVSKFVVDKGIFTQRIQLKLRIRGIGEMGHSQGLDRPERTADQVAGWVVNRHREDQWAPLDGHFSGN